MALLQSKDGTQHFTFEHSRDYQQVQFKFLDAVKSMDPNNIVVCSFFGLIAMKYMVSYFGSEILDIFFDIDILNIVNCVAKETSSLSCIFCWA